MRAAAPRPRTPRGRAWARRLLGLLALPTLLLALAMGLDRLPTQNAEPATADAGALTAAARSAAAPPPATHPLARGQTLARLANCVNCHTAPGGHPLAGGRGIATPFGTVYAGNLTPDPATGLGHWSADDFWRALHHGRGRDGRRLVPAFPYTSFTHLARADSDALFAWLRSLPPVTAARPSHALRWPYGTEPALAVWRLLSFRVDPEPASPPAGPTAERGAWLVRGPGHCAECHAERTVWGGLRSPEALRGGLMPLGDWAAPALACLTGSAGRLDETRTGEFSALMRGSAEARGSVMGPMAEVVIHSTQHWGDDDLRAVALHLARLPCPPAPVPPAALPPAQRTLGQTLYARHCAACHGQQGEGISGVYPALAGNLSVTQASPVNLIQALRHGGFAPSTLANPRPYGMPPQFLNDEEMAAVASWVRQAWGNQAEAVDWLAVSRMAR